jgi:hypothetical protein
LSAGEITVHEDGVTPEETIADHIMIEQPSQEELQGVTYMVSLVSELAKTNFEALNLAMVTDVFDADTFDKIIDTEQHVEEDDETTRSESDEELTGVTPYDVPTSSRIDWGSYYTDEELRALKLKHITFQDYPNHKDVSQIGSALCDSVVVDDEGNPRVQEEVIKKGQMFETLDIVKLFFQEYAVRRHRPYYVVKSNKTMPFLQTRRTGRRRAFTQGGSQLTSTRVRRIMRTMPFRGMLDLVFCHMNDELLFHNLIQFICV